MLLARALSLQEDWPQVGIQAQWILDHAAEDRHKEWADFFRAQAAYKLGDAAAARQILKRLAQTATSPPAKKSATDLLEQIER